MKFCDDSKYRVCLIKIYDKYIYIILAVIEGIVYDDILKYIN